IVAFVTSLLRVWGMAGFSVGSATLSTLVVSLAVPASAPLEPATRPLYLIVGGLWAMAVVLVLWPIRPFRPARIAIAECYSAFATLCEQTADALGRDVPKGGHPVVPPAGAAMRVALEHARTVLVRLRGGRPGSVDRGERLLVLGASVDQLFGHVVALGETLAAARADGRHPSLDASFATLLRELAFTSQAIAVAVQREDGDALVSSAVDADAVQREVASASRSPTYDHAAMIAGRLGHFTAAAVRTLSGVNGGRDAEPIPKDTGLHAAVADLREAESPFASLGAILAPDSLVLRFAARLAVVTTAAVALAHVFSLERGYWMTVTVIVIMQPYTGVTFTRALQRVAGTVLGALLAAALGAAFHDPRAILVIAFLFVGCCVALLPLNYAIFSIFLTPTFVLLAEASAGDWNLAPLRAANTVLGGALALLGARVLWPSPERARFPVYAAAALRACAAYLRNVVSHYDDPSGHAGHFIRSTRRVVGVETMNAEESLQRMIDEAPADTRSIAPGLVLIAYVRRLTASVAALSLTRHAPGRPASELVAPLCEEVARRLDAAAEALGSGVVPVLARDDPPWGAIPNALVRQRMQRLFAQVSTIADAVARLGGADRAEPLNEGNRR
nr:FUSC family protein [Gemmatimonadaceae bacterium]